MLYPPPPRVYGLGACPLAWVLSDSFLEHGGGGWGGGGGVGPKLLHANRSRGGRIPDFTQHGTQRCT